MPDTPTTDPLLPAIEEVLILNGISATAFGYRIAGDPALVGKLRGGMVLKRKRRAKVEAGLKELEQERSKQ
jgi:hypothetical protein